MTSRIGVSLLVAVLWGCTGLAPIDARRYIPAHRPPSVWVTLRDDSTVLLRGPRLTPDGDTLVGFVAGGGQRLIPFSDVTAARTMRPAPMQSALLAGGAAVLIGGLLLIVTH